MSAPNQHTLSQLAISPSKKTRRTAGPMLIIGIVLLVLVAGAIVFMATRQSDRKPIPSRGQAAAATTATPAVPANPPKPGDAILTVSGYVIPHARIEISPRFQGTVKLINVKKGDKVKKGDVMVQLEDDEFRARILEAQGRVALAEANLANSELNLRRQAELVKKDVDSQRAFDDAKRARDAAAAELTVAKGQLELAQVYLDWCTIRAPIDGTILEKLVDPNELVVPQSFGGTRGPSTALVSLADLNDLQVEIDLNEADTPKVHLKQKCRISPEAYPDKKYDGYVFEVAPEANRSKGTLQVKVQVEKPDSFLTPELSAKVDFLAD
ncbi:MAG: efflux RND transporter periplasmic adaptor subunit [Verrucomicrobiae bacterium]|nr:efflux RND transporter periplasmic adaptor subunit [Verrucomicrobiae bacterium]